MASTWLTDSTIIITVVNNRKAQPTADGLLAEGVLLAGCPVNVTEVFIGMRPQEPEKTEEFLASLDFYPVTWEIAKYAGSLYRE